VIHFQLLSCLRCSFSPFHQELGASLASALRLFLSLIRNWQHLLPLMRLASSVHFIAIASICIHYWFSLFTARRCAGAAYMPTEYRPSVCHTQNVHSFGGNASCFPLRNTCMNVLVLTILAIIFCSYIYTSMDELSETVSRGMLGFPRRKSIGAPTT